METPKSVIFSKKPKLRSPNMVCGIDGWVDGGEAATGTVKYFIRKLGAKSFAHIPIDRFHVFHVPGQPSLRPDIKIENGLLKKHRLPGNELFYCNNTEGDNDLILMLGTEPNFNWEEYALAIVKVVEEFAVRRIYTPGGVLDRAPHTREPNVSCVCSNPEIKKEMQRYGVQFTSYEGPGTFSTTLLDICQKRDIEMVSLMTRATYYPEHNILIPHNPKSIRSIVKRLNNLLGLNLDMADLNEQVREFEGKLNFMASQNTEFQAYISKLEKEYVEIKYEEPLDLSADEAVQIAEELLRKKSE